MRCISFERQHRKNYAIFSLVYKTDYTILEFTLNQIKNFTESRVISKWYKQFIAVENYWRDATKQNKNPSRRFLFCSRRDTNKNLICVIFEEIRSIKICIQMKSENVFKARDVCYEDRQDVRFLQQYHKSVKADYLEARIIFFNLLMMKFILLRIYNKE